MGKISYLDSYRKRICNKGNTTQELMLSDAIDEFKQYLYNSPTFNQINKYNEIEKIDCTIQDASFNNKQSGDEHILCVLNESTLDNGDVIEWSNRNWLITFEEDNVIKSHRTFIIRPCNYYLKFYNSISKVITVPCITENKTLWTLGVEEQASSPIVMGDAKLNITMPNNIDTQGIKRDKRFIVDGMCWKVTNISRLNDGILQLICGEDQEKVGIDDMINEVPANEYLPIAITFPQISYILTSLSTLQLTPTITQGTQTLTLPIIYTSSDPTIATVDGTGLITAIGVGTCNISCALADNPSISASVEIVVNTSIVSNVATYSITTSNGLDYIKKTSTVTFTANKYIDNVLDNTAQFTFSIDYGALPSSVVTMTVFDSRSVKLRNNVDVGSVALECTDNISGIVTSMVIQLRNIYGN